MTAKHSVFHRMAGPTRPGHKPLFIVGHGRSGTTWVGRTLSQHPSVLYYDEPCRFVCQTAEDRYANFISYVRANEEAGAFKSRLDSAMSGHFLAESALWASDPRKLVRRLFGAYRIVIKEVASVMSVEWVKSAYDPAFLILFRHPCSVALSEMDRHIDTEISKRRLLGLTNAFADHLQPFERLIRRASRPYEVYGAIYGARNRVLANFAERHQIKHVLLYEDLARDPVANFGILFEWYGFDWSERIRSYIIRNTTTEKTGFYDSTKNAAMHIERWKLAMTQEEATQVRDFVLPFNLPYYGNSDEYLVP